MDLMMDVFSSHLDLEQSNLRCEITGNSSLKRVKMVGSGAKNEDFTKYCFKTLGIFFRILERYVTRWACIKQFPVFRELSINQQVRIPSVTTEDKFLTFKSLPMWKKSLPSLKWLLHLFKYSRKLWKCDIDSFIQVQSFGFSERGFKNFYAPFKIARLRLLWDKEFSNNNLLGIISEDSMV